MNREPQWSLAVEILSLNRRDALMANLSLTVEEPVASQTPIVVVDNASTDGSAVLNKESPIDTLSSGRFHCPTIPA